MHGLRLVVLAAVGCAVVAAACGGDSGERTPAPTPTPERPGVMDIIADWVAANRNVDFIGDCADAREGLDVGKLCATLAGTRGRMVAYHIGPTFSEHTAIAILNDTGGEWEVVSIRNRNPNEEGVPGIDWPLQVGDRVIVIGLGEDDCLNVREQPSVDAAALICVGDGTTAIIQEGPVEGPTYRWWRIAGEGFDGWSAATWLRLADAIADLFAPQQPEAGE